MASEMSWERMRRQLARALGRGPMSLEAARRCYDELPDEPLDARTIRCLAQAARSKSRWLHDGSALVAGVWIVTDGPVSRHVVGLVWRSEPGTVFPLVTRIVRTPGEVMVVVDSQSVSEHDVARATDRADGDRGDRSEYRGTTPWSVCIDSPGHAGPGWVVDTSQATLRDIASAGPVVARESRKAS